MFSLVDRHGTLQCSPTLLCVLDGDDSRAIMHVEGTAGEVLEIVGMKFMNANSLALEVTAGSTVKVVMCGFFFNEEAIYVADDSGIIALYATAFEDNERDNERDYEDASGTLSTHAECNLEGYGDSTNNDPLTCNVVCTDGRPGL